MYVCCAKISLWILSFFVLGQTQMLLPELILQLLRDCSQSYSSCCLCSGDLTRASACTVSYVLQPGNLSLQHSRDIFLNIKIVTIMHLYLFRIWGPHSTTFNSAKSLFLSLCSEITPDSAQRTVYSAEPRIEFYVRQVFFSGPTSLFLCPRKSA